MAVEGDDDFGACSIRQHPNGFPGEPAVLRVLRDGEQVELAHRHVAQRRSWAGGE
jgi:hypothetical protein